MPSTACDGCGRSESAQLGLHKCGDSTLCDDCRMHTDEDCV